MLAYYLDKFKPQEVYSIKMTEIGFEFSFKYSLYLYLLEIIKRDNVLQLLSTIRKTIIGDIIILSVDLPFITFPNLFHKKLNWFKLKECSIQVSLILDLLNMSFEKNNPDRDFCLSDSPQLLSIQTRYIRDHSCHNAPIGIGFSERIRELLQQNYHEDTVIENSELTALNFYLKLSCERKSKFEKALKKRARYKEINVYVRNRGVPHFIVPGTCACLGANPDQFKYDGDMQSHNMDNPLQQLTMLCAVVSFWNDVLKPLYKEKRKEING